MPVKLDKTEDVFYLNDVHLKDLKNVITSIVVINFCFRLMKFMMSDRDDTSVSLLTLRTIESLSK